MSEDHDSDLISHLSCDHITKNEDSFDSSGSDIYTVPRFSTLSLCIIWVLGLILSLMFGVLADVFQDGAPAFPLIPVTHLAVGLNGLCAFLSIPLGFNLWNGYSIYQPFAGGEKYVILQSCGWTLVASCSTLMLVYLLMLHPPGYRYGALTILQIFSSLGNVLLGLSLRFFSPAEARRRASRVFEEIAQGKRCKSSLLNSMLQSPNSESGLVVIFLLSQIILCYFGAMFQDASGPIMIIFTVFHLMNAILIYLVLSWEQRAGHKIFRSFSETLYFFFSLVIYLSGFSGGIVLIRIGNIVPPFAFGMTALSSFFGVSSMLALARTSHSEEKKQPLSSVVARYGRCFLSAGTVLMACIVLGSIHYIRKYRAYYDQTEKGKVWIDGVLLSQTISLILLLLLTLATQLTGRMIYGESFGFFQPFCGCKKFVVLQAFGWAFFSASILSLTMHMTAKNFRWALFATTTGVMGHLFIQLSIEAFAVGCTIVGETLLDNQKKEDVYGYNKKKNIFNGALILSLIIQLVSIILRVVIDISQIQMIKSHPLNKNVLLSFSSLGFLVSVPMAHFSGKEEGIPLFHPFQGSGTYIALQALGWATYTLFALQSIGIIFFSMNNTNPPFFLQNHHPFMGYTLEGLLQMAPLVLIALSVAVEAPLAALRQRRHDKVMESLNLLRATLEENFSHRDLREQVALQFALRTLASASLSPQGIRCNKKNFQLGNKDLTSKETIAELNSREKMSEGKEKEEREIHFSEYEEDDDDNLSVLANLSKPQHGAASLLVLMFCIASGVGYIVAALWDTTVPLIGLVFSVSGLGICTISCVSVQTVYGVLMHGTNGEYTFFMPFKGGTVFVTLQIAGWSCYAFTFILTLMHTLENERGHFLLPTAALFSVFSQLLILASIPKFDARRRRKTYLEENGEGVVAMLVFLGAFLFAHLYIHVQRMFFAENDELSTAGGDYYTGVPSKRLKVPFFIIAFSLVSAVPCLLITLRRSTKRWGRVAKSPQRDLNNEDESQWERHKSVIAQIFVQVSEVMMLLLGMSTPMALGFLWYYIAHSEKQGLFRILQFWFPVILLSGVLASIISFIPQALHVGLGTQIVNIRCCIVTFALYSMPLICGIILFSPLVLLPFYSVGAYFTAFITPTLAVLGSFKQVRMVLRFSVYAVLGYVTYVEYLRVVENNTIRFAMTTLICYLIDVLQLSFWLWYLPFYEGNPEETGSRRNLAFTNWVRKYLFSDAERYFNFRVFRDDETVDLRDSSNQYIFSFHPHGVFPGTALFCYFTEKWRRSIGWNTNTYLATHVATVIFNIPLMREFNLSLGVLAVTRTAILSNLSRGNSSLIVTGGQAELVLTKRSNTLMSLVAYHQGFIKLSIKERVPLVPMLCFAEQNVLDVTKFPRIQRIALKFLGFPFPMLPFGRWLFPLPHPTPLTLVVGSPLQIPTGADVNNPEDVSALADAYFASLKELFYKYRAKAGYPDMELALHTKPKKK
ncbi:putative diacylglycerol acyltransferase [Trypanosoma theileri]|uniref:Putative diacylglycerol acyltransferase n=1 Tax=Trypanosoma theileri TaxID=67003 RepID=A0A1X0P4J0_9TRYP|nr:putative diacylglycerol acyltransferase [Trypanosoma theileri]ORC91751.1 putative diacylglycerol acyltransferase [Trypanosoma theileri]